MALACSKDDICLAVQAKREVSRLWADIERAPYRSLFNATTTSAEIWSAVLILRTAEKHLAASRDQLEGRQQSFMVHLNRVVTWIVNQLLRKKYTVESEDPAVLASDVAKVVPVLVPHLAALADSDYGGYPANLAKNASECEKFAQLELEYLAEVLPPD